MKEIIAMFIMLIALIGVFAYTIQTIIHFYRKFKLHYEKVKAGNYTPESYPDSLESLIDCLRANAGDFIRLFALFAASLMVMYVLNTLFNAVGP